MKTYLYAFSFLQKFDAGQPITDLDSEYCFLIGLQIGVGKFYLIDLNAGAK